MWLSRVSILVNLLLLLLLCVVLCSTVMWYRPPTDRAAGYPAPQPIPSAQHVAQGLFLLAPASGGLTWLLFRLSKERKSAGNILSVFGSVFGILTTLYFLYNM